MNLLSVLPRTQQARFSVISESQMMIQPVARGRTSVIPTETVAVIGAKADELRWVRREFGLDLVQEGSHGKVLLAVAGDAEDPVDRAAQAARALFERGNVEGAHPNFLRLVQRPGPQRQGGCRPVGPGQRRQPGRDRRRCRRRGRLDDHRG